MGTNPKKNAPNNGINSSKSNPVKIGFPKKEMSLLGKKKLYFDFPGLTVKT
jgi:hypothetical protein